MEYIKNFYGATGPSRAEHDTSQAGEDDYMFCSRLSELPQNRYRIVHCTTKAEREQEKRDEFVSSMKWWTVILLGISVISLATKKS